MEAVVVAADLNLRLELRLLQLGQIGKILDLLMEAEQPALHRRRCQ
jgi:hypothetical protein